MPLEIVVRELAVARKRRDAEVDGTVAAVGVAFFFELVNRGGHLRDVLGRARDALGPLEAKGVAVGEKRFGVDRGVVVKRLALCDGVADDLIVHVGDVHDVVEFVAVQVKHAAQQIVKDEGAEVADVREVVNGGSAGVHADGVRVDGDERLDLLGQRVVEAQGHVGESFMVATGRCGAGGNVSVFVRC